MKDKIYVSAGGQQGDFDNVTDALYSIPEDNHEPVTIFIAPGIYHEKITIDRDFVTLEGTGERNEDVILTFDDYANFIMEDGMKRGTFRSYSVFIDAHDVTLKNLTVENASGDSLTHGQAIALYADGDRLTVDSGTFWDIRTPFLQAHCRQRRFRKTVLSDRSSLHPESTEDSIIKTAISAVMLILFSEVRPPILKIAQ